MAISFPNVTISFVNMIIIILFSIIFLHEFNSNNEDATSQFTHIEA